MGKEDRARQARRRRDPDGKRVALQEAAVSLFTEFGYEKVSIANVAREAGIAVGTVYRFYENKLALLRAMLETLEDEFVEQMQADWALGGDVSARLDRVCDGLFALAEERDTLLRLLSMTTDVVYDDGGLPGDRIRARIVVMYEEGLNLGAFRHGDVGLHAAMAHGLVEGAIMGWLRTGNPTRAKAARQLASVMKGGFLTD